MLPRLATRVFSRVYASGLSLYALPVAGAARQHVAARTFLTTAVVAHPAATKAKADDASDGKPKTAKTAGRTKTKATKGKALTEKQAAALAAKKEREAARKKAAAEKAKAREQAQKEKAKAKAKLEKEKARANDPKSRFDGPLRTLKVRKDELPPKPSGAFAFFVADHVRGLQARTEGPIKFADISKGASAAWRDMTDEQKKPYFDKARQSLEEYTKAAEEWYKKSDPRIVKALSLQGHPLPKVPQAQDTKRPKQPYVAFVTENYHQVPVPPEVMANHRERLAYVSRELSARWKALPEEEKTKYVQRYEKELSEWEERQKARKAEAEA
ncbi:hypothetical protein BN946_scf184777.g9 [Trametes cinnabarina]|uniref:HMG box domain-containing protein n=1 Tax=Pycnoporus cinnabarinus TaxID=5643 RepID=A0A060S9M4_PYCCI|nr:hypothetical protein BN946_scf184777.g9 [Trametes cinnabarina]